MLEESCVPDSQLTEEVNRQFAGPSVSAAIVYDNEVEISEYFDFLMTSFLLTYYYFWTHKHKAAGVSEITN